MFSGYWILGKDPNSLRFGHSDDKIPTIGERFAEAAAELWHNLKAVVTSETVDWSSLMNFYNEVFFPFMIGGILPGIVAGTIAYYAALPVIRVYKDRRKGTLRARFLALKSKASKSGQKKTADGQARID